MWACEAGTAQRRRTSLAPPCGTRSSSRPTGVRERSPCRPSRRRRHTLAAGRRTASRGPRCRLPGVGTARPRLPSRREWRGRSSVGRSGAPPRWQLRRRAATSRRRTRGRVRRSFAVRGLTAGTARRRTASTAP